MAALRRTTGPTEEPITLAEAKLHLRVDHADDDALITALIKAARETCEHRLQRTLISSTWVHTEDSFPEAIRLRMGRVLAITTVQYRDSAGALQTLSAAGYTLDNASELANWLYPASGASWPATWDQPNGVIVTYTAGFGASAAAVPDGIKAWLKLAVATWYKHREALAERKPEELPHAFWDGLLDPYRVVEV